MAWYSDLKPPVRDHMISRMEEALSRFGSDMKERASNGYKFIFLTNAGGAVAVLGYLGSSNSSSGTLAAIVALAIFIVGVISAGRVAVLSYDLALKNFTQLAQHFREFENNEIEDTSVQQFFRRISDIAVLNPLHRWAQLSFWCFVAGCIVGFILILFSSGLLPPLSELWDTLCRLIST